MTKSMATEQKKEKKRSMHPISEASKDSRLDSSQIVVERAKHEFRDLTMA